MTECERIIEQGILPESFFEEEVRCDFLVTQKRKKIWAIELDIYLKFVEICNKHHLKFWGEGGTLLGAVRHNGFIPWDDDIDVIMPRQDYDKLLEIGPQEFSAPYFFQTPMTDPGSAFSIIKIRNSNTSCIANAFIKGGFNQGICIDVFPLDFIDPNTYYDNRKMIYESIMRNASYMKRTSLDALDEASLKNYKEFPPSNPVDEWDRINQIASSQVREGSEYAGICAATFYSPEAFLWKTSWFDSTILHDFETIKIPMPGEIDLRLRQQYGNYWELPAIESRGKWHSGVLWDPDRGYAEYRESIMQQL